MIVPKGAPFRYKGVVNVEDCVSSEDVMHKAKLDFEVAKCPIVAKMPGLIEDKDKNDGFLYGGDYFNQVYNAYATYRTDHNIPLGICKEKYTVVQNIEAFKFFDDAIGKNKARWQTAGCFGNGERIFVSAKLPQNILVNNDPVDNYLVFTNSHDGTSGVKILFTPIRVICQNTLNAAIKTSTNYVSFRHTKSINSKIDIASEILGICNKTTSYLEEYYNAMKKKVLTDDQATEVFAKTILTDAELNNIKATGHTINQIANRDWRAIEDSNVSMKKVNVISGIRNYYHTGIGQASILGNGWGAYNAISGYYSNVDNSEETKRMDTLLYGDRASKIKAAGDLIINNY